MSFLSKLFGGDKDADNSTDAGQNPEAHDDFGFTPSLGLKMMMKWCGDKYLSMEELLADELDETGTSFNHEHQTDNWKE